jgi:1-acyl-sn-glycerol-3-phosphate acyltransferase
MRVLRAVAHNTLFYGVLIFHMIIFIWSFFISRDFVMALAKYTTGLQLKVQRLFGMKVEFRGLENIPSGGAILAVKHQSMWETMMLLHIVPDPIFIYKKELDKLPLFGAYLRKIDFVSIDRSRGTEALKHMSAQAKVALDKGRRLIIFPEGTRRAPGAEPRYKFGVAATYDEVDHPVVPVVLNSGVFWSNLFWRGDYGTIVAEFLPPIPAGLERQEFFERLQGEMEAASDRLLIETSRQPNCPRLGAEAQARLKALGV